MESWRKYIVEQFVSAILNLLFTSLIVALGALVLGVWAYFGGVRGVALIWLESAFVTATVILVISSIVASFRARRMRILQKVKKGRFITGEQIGFLDAGINLERAQTDFSAAMASISSLIVQQGKGIKKRADEILQIRGQGGPSMTAKLYKSMSKAAKEIDKSAAQIETYLPNLKESIAVFFASQMSNAQRLSHAENDMQKAQVDSMMKSSESLAGTAIETLGQMKAYLAAILGNKGASQVLDAALNRIATAVKTLIEINEGVVKSSNDMTALLRTKLATPTAPTNV